jgi:DNA sulfur modification protein DndB
VIGEIPDVVLKNVGSTNYLFGTIGSDRIKSVTFVPVIEPTPKGFLTEDTNDGYQRPGSPSRMRAFMKFLLGHPDHVVPPILLSGRGNWTFQAGPHNNHVGTLRIDAPAAIIDGQHRVGGFVALFEEHNEIRDVPFILLNGLSIDQELKEFVVVNNSQKGVPKSLTEYLGDSDESQVAWALNTEEDSPFKDRISRTSMKREQLFQLHSVAKQIKRLFDIGAVSDLDVATKTEFTIRLWTTVADALPEEWADIEHLDNPDSKGRRDFESKLLELTGLIAWSLTGAHIFSRSYSEATGMNWDNVKRLVQAASNLDWSKDGQFRGLTGEVGGKAMADDMLRLLPPEGAPD